MSNKSYQNSLFKRIIDLGKVTSADVDDLVRIWRVGSGDEKAITLANFVATVDADLGSGGSSLTELVNALQNQVDNLTFLDLTDTPASYTGQAGLFPRVNSGESALEFFNPLSLPLTGYTVGSNTALASTDTILGAFGKVQGQINARVSGSGGASGAIAIWSGVNSLTADGDLVWDSTNNRLGLAPNPSATLYFGNSFNTKYLALRADAGANATGFYGLGAYNSGSNFGIGIWTGTSTNTPQTIAPNFFINAPSGVLANTRVGILTDNPTNTLDVNGTARIRTLSNATGDFVTASATGVLQKRTAAEVVSDLGIGSGLWTDATTFIYRDSPVVVGRTTLPTNATFAVQSKTATSSNQFFQIINNSGTILNSLRQDGINYFSSPVIGIGVVNTNQSQFRHRATVSGNSLIQFLIEDSSAVTAFSVSNIGQGVFRSSLIVGSELRTGGAASLSGTGASLKGTNNGVDAFRIYDASNVIRVKWRSTLGLEILNTSGNRTISLSNNLTLDEGTNQVFGTTTGTKIGTATSQKLAFWNATPIVQPTTAVTGATLVGGGGTTITDTDTFDGYTLAQVVKALRNIGLLA